jgi:hypothetical protein
MPVDEYKTAALNLAGTLSDVVKFITKKHPEFFEVVIKHSKRGISQLNVPESFPAFRSYSKGSYQQNADLAISAINFFPRLMGQFLDTLYIEDRITRVDLRAKASSPVTQIGELFNLYGSDKGKASHRYDLIYDICFDNPAAVRNVVEIGMGTNNPDLLSNMGSSGHPGASLRAFRDFYVNAQVVGIDVDRSILFDEERIMTFWADQLDTTTLGNLSLPLQDGESLFIDDGLHYITANFNTLNFFLGYVKRGSIIIIEDIAPEAGEIFSVLLRLLPTNFSVTIYNMPSACVVKIISI